MKLKEKQEAIKLRKNGNTYSEILKKVPVSKSTLSLWLREVDLSVPQKKRIWNKNVEAQKKGAFIRREEKIRKIREIHRKSSSEIRNISKRELKLIGIALYWAEGVKEKEHSGACSVEFTNSDPEMVKIFIKWLNECFDVDTNRFRAKIYIHKNYKNKIKEIDKYWKEVTGLDHNQFHKPYFKKHNPKTIRYNKGGLYKGNLRVTVVKSSDIVRKIAGGVKGMVNSLD